MSDVGVVQVENLSKTFLSGTPALDRVTLSFRPGEVHALLGMNGSGKSTLVKILAGFHEPDPGGSVTVGGEPLPFGDPGASREMGLRFVHQDLALLLGLSTVENLALDRGYLSGRFGPISWKKEVGAARELMDRFGHVIDVTAPVGTLSMSERTGVAIARAFSGGLQKTRLLVLDEPTAAMPAHEVEVFFRLLQAVKSEGVAVVYITHHLNETFEQGDWVSVLRDGQLVASRSVRGLRHDELVERIIGSQLATAPPKPEALPSAGSADAVLELEDVSGGALRSFSARIEAGEVVGLAGVMGCGSEHVCRAIFGGIPRDGTVKVHGVALAAERPDVALGRGVALVPADRREDALFPEMYVRENITMGDVRAFVHRGTLRRRMENDEVAAWIRQLQIKVASPEMPVALLSGGNQQKVVFARILRRAPTVLLLDEPTQGVDVSAKADIHSLILGAAAAGSAVVVATSDTEELVRLCTRVLVLSDGRLVGELAGDDITEESIERMSLHSDALAAAPTDLNGKVQT